MLKLLHQNEHGKQWFLVMAAEGLKVMAPKGPIINSDQLLLEAISPVLPVDTAYMD